MDRNLGRDISRRAMMKYVAVTVALGSIAGIASVSGGTRPAFAAAEDGSADGDVALQSLVSVGEYDYTDLAGVHAEYLDAVRSFPFPLPEGVTFPAVSSLQDTVPGAIWERGAGKAEAYFFWHRSVTGAADAAQARGDGATASKLLNVLESGFWSSTRRAVWVDADTAFQAALEQARKGDFSSLILLVS